MQIDNVDFETDSKLTVDAFLSTRNDLLNLAASFLPVVLFLVLSFLTLGWSLLGDKPTWLLMLLLERSCI